MKFTWIMLLGEVSTVFNWTWAGGAEVRAGVVVAVDDGAGIVVAEAGGEGSEAFGVVTAEVKSIGLWLVPSPLRILLILTGSVSVEMLLALGRLLLALPGGNTLLTLRILICREGTQQFYKYFK